MLSRFRNWLRVLFTPDWPFWAVVICIPALWSFQLVLTWFVRWLAATVAPELALHERYIPVIPPLHHSALLIVAMLYGLGRGSFFHPVQNKRYGTWLAQTPWQYPNHLPFGPVHLVAQDAFALAILMIFVLLPPWPEFNALYIPIVFVAAYSFSLTFIVMQFDALLGAGIIFLMLFIANYFHDHPYLLAMGALAIYGVTTLGIARSLRDFPCSEAQREALSLVPYEKQMPPAIGLPIMPSARDAWYLQITPLRSILIACTMGLVIMLVAGHFQDRPQFRRGMFFVHAWSTFAAVFGRLVIYTANRWPPISLFGRLATRRLIIPRYDVVLLAPVATLLVALALPLVLLSLGTPPLVALPVSIAMTWYLVLALPPNFKTWRYTGHFRIAAPRRIGKEVVHI